MTLEPGTTTSRHSDDRQLLSLVAKKDRDAFETLYRRYHRRVFHFVCRLIRQPQAAEEVVSDSMFALWQAAGSFAGASRVSTWLLGIAYRQAMKHLERNRRHTVMDSDDELIAATVDVDPAADPAFAAMTDSYADLLQKCMDALPEHHRVVVELTAMGHSYGEIAEIVGCPENTVKTRMFHARLHLKRQLGDTEETAHDAQSPRAAARTGLVSIAGATRRSGYRI
jgi:RNA polymerase sigma factor (sigma-70 family)